MRKNSQLVIETHSDYIIDRVRMDVRDRKSALSAENVSILYVDRSGSEVRVHSIRLDDVGNIVGAPPAYRRFFLDELDRSIGP